MNEEKNWNTEIGYPEKMKQKIKKFNAFEAYFIIIVKKYSIFSP
jgi:hypothetical protein